MNLKKTKSILSLSLITGTLFKAVECTNRILKMDSSLVKFGLVRSATLLPPSIGSLLRNISVATTTRVLVPPPRISYCLIYPLCVEDRPKDGVAAGRVMPIVKSHAGLVPTQNII